MERRVKMVGTGIYVPEREVLSTELDEKLCVTAGWTEQKSGVYARRYINRERASEMAAKAAIQACENAGISITNIDCIISGSGTMEQPIPCNGALVQNELGLTRVPAFDVNTTCLSFVQALDVASYMIDAGRFHTVLITASEIASPGLDWTQKESSILFGDGAAAAIVQRTPKGETSRILGSHLETFSEGAHFSEIRGGGTNKHLSEYRLESEKDFLFDMNGRAIFKLAYKYFPAFMERLYKEAAVSKTDLSVVLPHQASGMSMRILQKKLGFSDQVFFNNIRLYGNTIAASIPLALHEAITSGKLKRGEKGMLIGTSAGLSIGGIIFEY